MVTVSGAFGGGVALITGGSQGLGYAVAARLISEGAAGLLLVGRDPVKGVAAAASLSSLDCRAEFLAADLAHSDACDEVVATLDEKFGTCHSFVNCAAITDRGSVWDSTPELWDAILAVNVKAPGLLSQGVARIMARERVEGTIVLIGSIAGRGGPPKLLPYSTSKGALAAMTRNLAFALMRHRIRVNLLCPGWMDTPNEDVVQRTFDGAADGWLEQAEAEMPFGRLIKPNEIARTIVHLATTDSGMMTGAVVEWDQTVMGAGDSVFPGPELGQWPSNSGMQP
ncbi:MAG: SDR family oxidoreductase [Acidimicrobiaceae bacterium]|nr:SDR family oxidoreductase [Acidimicrobiaceae bacterium]MXZ66376.1 SDR family oxidoreductase [Acidimicrobiaceae bacterium]MYE57194.1 SDR family oxidoreductase [Acidimicrobiaceae bacterium]MYF34322.1 SDR family oxidoreductase [Acidimicrobiaceae bacterium]MYG77968.1 SDR family oxidoreductase [Acidimicrobiaceae bacterium]